MKIIHWKQTTALNEKLCWTKTVLIPTTFTDITTHCVFTTKIPKLTFQYHFSDTCLPLKKSPSSLVSVISPEKQYPVTPVEPGPPLHRPRTWVHLLETVENEEFLCSGSGNAKPAS